MLNFTDFEQMFSMGDDGDTLMMLVWIIPIVIFVFYGQQIQLLVTSGEIKKAIKKLDKFSTTKDYDARVARMIFKIRKLEEKK